MDLIATLQCADQPGIVHAMTSAVLACGGNIIENQQFTDEPTNTFVMRTRFETSQGIEVAQKSLNDGLGRFSPTLHIRPTESKPRALVLVTKESHCLRDLLYLLELGELPIEIPVVVSNHEELRSLVESHGFTFIYLPVTATTKAAQEKSYLILSKSTPLILSFLLVTCKCYQMIFVQHFQAESSISTTHSYLVLKALSRITRHMLAA